MCGVVIAVMGGERVLVAAADCSAGKGEPWRNPVEALKEP